jgi:transcriptional regulator GlxA family with amidase domain
LKPTPFGIIRPAITGPGYEFKKGYFLSMLEDCDLSPTQIRIIKTLKQSKYYACSPMLGFHPTHLLFKIMKIQKEIAGNPRRTMPLSKLCTLVHLSPAWMSLKFNEVTKISMQSFALKIRFCHALWQICASEKQIKQIAFEFGYKPSSFSERFNSIWATRPGMIRKQNNRSR